MCKQYCIIIYLSRLLIERHLSLDNIAETWLYTNLWLLLRLFPWCVFQTLNCWVEWHETYLCFVVLELMLNYLEFASNHSSEMASSQCCHFHTPTSQLNSNFLIFSFFVEGPIFYVWTSSLNPQFYIFSMSRSVDSKQAEDSALKKAGGLPSFWWAYSLDGETN